MVKQQPPQDTSSCLDAVANLVSDDSSSISSCSSHGQSSMACSLDEVETIMSDSPTGELSHDGTLQSCLSLQRWRCKTGPLGSSRFLLLKLAVSHSFVILAWRSCFWVFLFFNSPHKYKLQCTLVTCRHLHQQPHLLL